MPEQIIEDSGSCQSKIGRGIRQTGKKSADKFVSSEQGAAAKEAQPTQTVEPKTDSLTPSPGAESFLPSPTLTTSQETATQKTCAHGASDAIPPMTPSTMPKPDSEQKALESITGNRLCLVGKSKKPTRQDLIRAIGGDELHWRRIEQSG